MGDFNAILRPSDRSGGANDWQSHHEDFQDCITRSSLQQIPYNGIRLSWHNGQTGRNTIMRKLDWVFGNLTLLTRWPAVRATFLPRHNSDHSAMVLGMEALEPREKSSFKFMNQWADHGDFQGIVQGVWGQRIVGNRMFQLTSKLAILKQHLRVKHRRSTSHLSLKVFQAKVQWNEAQYRLDLNPSNDSLKEVERQKASVYMDLSREEEAFFKQRSRIQWLTLGDQNTRFFHRSLIHRSSRNVISRLVDNEGNVHSSNKDMGDLAVNYYRKLSRRNPRRL
ncbi:hypothetical protein OIU84_011019 [Salix udensis]|uniref:Endonuclease/exonuclease/phosphatase domain-containing protein n=1 Tax=Salix udensis TaxID=889485 RepID=A0AAD6JNJ2_9ROSI|nr:hypothetical protein OIU84_011019 [Salix udensis]